jgi:hypothetical protein
MASQPYAVVEQHKGTCSTGKPMRRRPVTGQLDQVAARFSIQEAGADHRTEQKRCQGSWQRLVGFRRVGVYKKPLITMEDFEWQGSSHSVWGLFQVGSED